MQLLMTVPILLLSVIIHEVAHGYVAYKRGDDTARRQGRLTLNPWAHIDIFGSIMFPILLIITKAPFLIGWAKPVPVNPFNLRNPVRDHLYVSVAGIAANGMLALIFALLLGFYYNIMQPSEQDPLSKLLRYGMQINVILAIFNILPIPPLDGSWILYHLLPPQYAKSYRALFPYGIIIIILLLITGIIQNIIIAAYRIIAIVLELIIKALII